MQARVQRPALVISLIAFSIAGLAWAIARAPAIEAVYPVTAVAEGVHVIHGPLELPNKSNQGFMNNPGWVETDAGVVLVDPGSSVQVGEMVLRAIKGQTDRPIIAVFNTHVHGDHWLGNQAVVAAYPDVPIYAHPKLIERVKAGDGLRWLDLMSNLTEGATAGTEIVGPNTAVDNGDKLMLGGLEFQIIHLGQDGKAHTDTDIMIYVPARGVIFLGDNGSYERIIRLDDGSFRGNIKALDAALASGAKVFVPGHGKSGGEIAASAYRDYLKILYAEVRRYFDEGLSDFEIKPKILPVLARWKPWYGFDDELGKHVSLAYLEAESAAF